MPDRRVLFEWVMQPGTGKAVELLAGRVLRIEQVEGLQCVDFNCFNLHDYKEFMHCGRTRTVHGFNPSKGSFLWSAPPRERALLYILEDTYGRNDVLFPRCSAYVYESAYGFDAHTSCQDIQAEAQREYGLTPDDVHDSFNVFMCTEVTLDGRATITRQETKPGDHIDLLALVDVLAVPNVCGADVMRTSNFALKPIRLTVFEGDAGRDRCGSQGPSAQKPADAEGFPQSEREGDARAPARSVLRGGIHQCAARAAGAFREAHRRGGRGAAAGASPGLRRR
jgi:uncharacterized protein YcgI (DUF1989 family)